MPSRCSSAPVAGTASTGWIDAFYRWLTHPVSRRHARECRVGTGLISSPRRIDPADQVK
jgi:hypothetical protein